ncbi:helix-turn-helix transcriptional regulator [Streptomyces sp. SBC-4]|nr:helix-turn-helix transcriptional regulator [Streptomyces sp. SBC-4]MDV5145871.1 helix-turn-helix transcriptional regulator [Streptomyces sp. SBC-4]
MAADHDQSTQTLSDVIRDRRAELGLSLRDAEERCVDPDTGKVVSRTYIDSLEKAAANLQPPTPARLRALAAGFDLPLALLREAAGRQFYGVSSGWAPSGKVQTFVARLEELDPAEQDRVLAMLEAYASVKPPKLE